MTGDMRLEGLVAAINEIVRLPQPPAAADLQRVCTAACRELRAIAANDRFLSLVQRSGAGASAPELDTVFSDLARFEAFLREELHLLGGAGLDQSAAAVLLEHARAFRTILQQRATLPVRGGIEDLRDEACERWRAG